MRNTDTEGVNVPVQNQHDSWGAVKETEDSPLPGGGEMGRLIREKEWGEHPLGPIRDWPQSLRTALSICLDSRFPILLWWGPELFMLYNDAYRPMLGRQKHPEALGMAGRACWPEIWDVIGPMLEDTVMCEGRATWSEDQLLVLHRNGYPEECYFTFSYSPIRDESGGVGGVFTAVTETTERVLSTRRLQTARDLGARTAELQSTQDVVAEAADVLAENRKDVPFALLYLLDEQRTRMHLAGTVGLEAGEVASPVVVALDADTEADGWPIARMTRTMNAETVDDLQARFGPLPGGPWPDPPETALVLPIVQSGLERPYGVLVAGISPRRRLDDDYRGFYELVTRNLASAIGNVRAYEEERRRAEALADVMMPGLDGFELLSALRDDDRMHDLPVVLLSARAGEDARIEGLEAGADDYLVKPFSARELLARIEAQLKLARLRREVAERERAPAEELRALNATLEERVAERTAELQRANRLLTQRNRELQDFAYVASHDLQEPLRKMRLFGDLLQSRFGEQLEEESALYLDRLERAAERMSQLLEHLLIFSRVATHGTPFEPVDLNEAAHDVLAELNLAIEEAGCRVDVEPLPTIDADRAQMRRLLYSLIDNAIRFRDPECASVVHVYAGHEDAAPRPATESGEELCRLVVEDNGIGFEEEHVDRIFDPFQQLHGRSAYGGTGMGLAIARRIVERHEGSITAESAPGDGSRFIVTLPVHHPRNAE